MSQGSFWPTSVWLQHKNHVHWALNYPGYKGAPAAGSGGPASGVTGGSIGLTGAAVPGAISALKAAGKRTGGMVGQPVQQVVDAYWDGIAAPALMKAAGGTIPGRAR